MTATPRIPAVTGAIVVLGTLVSDRSRRGTVLVLGVTPLMSVTCCLRH
jgi:hypothetical protein